MIVGFLSYIHQGGYVIVEFRLIHPPMRFCDSWILFFHQQIFLKNYCMYLHNIFTVHGCFGLT